MHWYGICTWTLYQACGSLQKGDKLEAIITFVYMQVLEMR